MQKKKKQVCMATYRETQTRSQSNVYSVRQVTRDITQHRDGTIKTLETETTKKQAFTQQEQIQREFAVAKELLINKKMDHWVSLYKNWKKPSSKRKKNIHERTKVLRRLGKNGDIPSILCNNFEEALAEQRTAIRYSCAMLDTDELVFADPIHQERFEQQVQLYQKCHGDADPDAYGSLYVADALNRLKKRRKRSLRMDSILEELKRDEERLTKLKAVNCREIAPGVLQRTSPPLFPFTDLDLRETDAMQQAERDISSNLLEEFLFTCLRTNATDPELLSPALSHLISWAILFQDKLGRQLDWPRLLEVVEMKERSLHSFPYTPSLFWGESTSEKDWFACCTFLVGKTTYENVWVELPLLSISTVYGKDVEQHFYQQKLDDVKRRVSRIREVPELLALVSPSDQQFDKLRRMQMELDRLLENKEEIAQLVQHKRELGTALHRLQMKSRRI